MKRGMKGMLAVLMSAVMMVSPVSSAFAAETVAAEAETAAEQTLASSAGETETQAQTNSVSDETETKSQPEDTEAQTSAETETAGSDTAERTQDDASAQSDEKETSSAVENETQQAEDGTLKDSVESSAQTTAAESEGGDNSTVEEEFTVVIYSSTDGSDSLAGVQYTLASSVSSRESYTLTSTDSGALSQSIMLAENETWTLTLNTASLPDGYVFSGVRETHTITGSEAGVLIDGTAASADGITYIFAQNDEEKDTVSLTLGIKTLTEDSSGLAGVGYTLTSSNPAKEAISLTSDTAALAQEISLAADGSETWTLALNTEKVPLGYQLSASSSEKHTISLKDEEVLIDDAAAADVTYTFVKLSKAFEITVDTLLSGSTDTHIPGAVYQILDADKNVVTSDGIAVTITSVSDAAVTAAITLTDDQYAALAAADGESQTWTVHLSETPEFYAVETPVGGDVTFALSLAEDGTLSALVSSDTAAKFILKAQNALDATVQDTAGKKLSDAQVSLVYTTDAGEEIVLISKTTSSKVNPVSFDFGVDSADLTEMTGALSAYSMTLSDLDGKKLAVRQTVLPEGYRLRKTDADTADTYQISFAYADGLATVDPEEMTLTDALVTAKLTINSVLKEDEKTAVKGAVYKIEYLREDGTYAALKYSDVLSGANDPEDGEEDPDATFTSKKKALTVQIHVPDDALSALDAATGEVKSASWRVVWQSSPGYTLASDETEIFYAALDPEGNTVTTVDLALGLTSSSAAEVTFTYEEKAVGTGKIRVTKKNYYNGSAIYFTQTRTFYVALFDADGNRVSEPKELTMTASATSASATFTKLEPGTYYVYEVRPSNYDKIVPASAASQGKYAYYASYSSSSKNVKNNNVVTVKKTQTSVPKVEISNHFSTMPKYSAMSASFYVTKQWDNSADKTVTKPDTFYFKVLVKDPDNGVYSSIQTTNSSGETVDRVFSISLSGTATSASKKLSLRVTASNPSRQIRIVEVNSDGSELAKDSKDSSLNVINKVSYKVSYTNQDITISADQASDPQVIIKNTVAASDKEDESETNDDDLVAELTLTKKVTYKNTAIRVNAVYYIGIFNDAALTDLRYKKALQFKNASEVSATLKINLYKLSSKEVTFYFAEVDKDGNVVGDGTSSGYEISQNKTSITLNKNNLKDEVVVTNNIKAGSKAESALTSASSGFAGDSAALAQAQALESESNASANSTTGDSSPILPLAAALGISALLIILLVVLAVKRRRR